jgi:hypothetical protein
MIRLFSDIPKQPTHSFHVDFKALVVNMAGAMVCALLAFVYFAVAVGGESRPIPASVFIILGVIALAVAVLGAVLAAVAKQIPRLAAVLTPLFLAGLFGSHERDEILLGLGLGSFASGLFLLGAAAAWGIKRRISHRKRCEPASLRS